MFPRPGPEGEHHTRISVSVRVVAHQDQGLLLGTLSASSLQGALLDPFSPGTFRPFNIGNCLPADHFAPQRATLTTTLKLGK